MACMCGDVCCPSCGPAQGNYRCLVCREWASEGCGCSDEAKDRAAKMQVEADALTDKMFADSIQWERDHAVEIEKSVYRLTPRPRPHPVGDDMASEPMDLADAMRNPQAFVESMEETVTHHTAEPGRHTWNRTDDELPPDGVVVRTIAESGTEQPLKREGRLWFVPDGSMYVYYTPTFWRRPDNT